MQERFAGKLPPFSQWRSDLVTVLLDDDDSSVNATFGVRDVTTGRLFTAVGRVRVRRKRPGGPAWHRRPSYARA